MSTELLDRPKTSDGDTDDEHVAHIVRKGGLTEALVEGREVEAICGKRWIPTRDPAVLPICPECRRIAAEAGVDVRSLR